MAITGTIVSNSNPPFRLNPSWRRNDGKWNPNAHVEYKSINATTYVSILHISNYSADDTGNYTLSASNVCGPSSSSLYIGKKSMLYSYLARYTYLAVKVSIYLYCIAPNFCGKKLS